MAVGVRLGLVMLKQGFDETLIRARFGDEHAFARIYSDLQPALLRYSHAHAPQLAEDITAEVWFQVTRALSRFVGDEQEFRAWIFSIARNKVIDQVRCDARRPMRLFVGTGEINGNGQDTRDVAKDYEDDQATRQALALVRRLPPTQAEVILLRVIAGLDPAHVARLLGKTPGAVRVLSLRGLRRLAGILPAQSDDGRREPISGDPRLLVDTARAKPYASSHPERRPAPDSPVLVCGPFHVPDALLSVNPVDHSEPSS